MSDSKFNVVNNEGYNIVSSIINYMRDRSDKFKIELNIGVNPNSVEVSTNSGSEHSFAPIITRLALWLWGHAP